MYRQVNIIDADRDCQRIVWREQPQDEFKYYRLNTVTYGTAPASFLERWCFPLRKWHSNEKEILGSGSIDSKDEYVLSDKGSIKTKLVVNAEFYLQSRKCSIHGV
ncbi:hypothetical protein QE152_g38226 [Popillia japonica]|uniref:Uncharacterized protein n=1 Tax=Popillia japonica TaxID=7064 RepID=A0AAW1I843_POPJA